LREVEHRSIQAVGDATASTLAAIEALLADRTKLQDDAPAEAAGGASAEEAGDVTGIDTPGGPRRESMSMRRHAQPQPANGTAALRMGRTSLECPRRNTAIEFMGAAPQPEMEFVAVSVVTPRPAVRRRGSLDNVVGGGAEAHHGGGLTVVRAGCPWGG
jgi:hypothetical protein